MEGGKERGSGSAKKRLVDHSERVDKEKQADKN